MNNNQLVKPETPIAPKTQLKASGSSQLGNDKEMPAVVVGGIGNNKYLLVKCRGWWVKSACQI